MKILVLGVGGIGGFFGGFLQESGADVTFLVRPKRKALLVKNKLKIISPLGNIKLEPNLILSNELKQNEYDCNSTFIVFLCKAGVDFDRDYFGDLILYYEAWVIIDPPKPDRSYLS